MKKKKLGRPKQVEPEPEEEPEEEDDEDEEEVDEDDEEESPPSQSKSEKKIIKKADRNEIEDMIEGHLLRATDLLRLLRSTP